MRDTILIVDDMEVNRVILREVFEREYNLLEAENGEQAMLLVKEYHKNISAMLLDLVMPVMDGYRVMEELGRCGMFLEFPVIIITAEDSVESEVQAFDMGASDIIMKPFEPHVVKRRVQNIIDLNLHKQNQDMLIEEQAARLRESNEVMIDALSSIIEYRSVETGQHIQRIRMFTRVLLEDVSKSYPEFDLDTRKINIIVSASSMHDIGKIAIPDAVLNKPGKLTPEEYEIMKTHSVKGCEMLSQLDRMSDKEYLQYACNICRYHHERWDGAGYPDGLKGDSIPVCAQVVGIADCYDALTTDRVYKKAISSDEAFNMILNGECGAFSPKLLESFKNVGDAFARLSREYSDRGVKKRKIAARDVARGVEQSETLNTLQMGQLKYFTLLHYTDSTVMEVDLDTGLYHVVYLSGEDFELLKSGNRFMDSICSFAQEVVHPEDKGMMEDFLGNGIAEFFAEGLMKRSWKYRIYSRAKGDYCGCRMTLLRISTNQPHQRKALLIWHEEEAGQRKPVLDEKLIYSLVGGVQICRNDNWYTMDRISEELVHLLGYTEAEIEEKFQKRLINMIHPGDRKEVLHRVREQLRSGHLSEVEYRMTAKDGRVLWVLDKSRLVSDADGEERFYSLLIDITQSKRAQDELRIMMERHQIIMEQTNDIIFEWDVEKDQLSYSSNWGRKFGYEPITEEASRRIVSVSHVHPEDLTLFQKLIRDITGGVPYEETEVRIADSQGRYLWCKIRVAAQFNSAGKVFKAVGIVADIDVEKRASQELQDKAERDELTMVYNKVTGRRKMEYYLEHRRAEQEAAMLIIDVDNFKQTNDSYGHMFGDSVLQRIAAELRGQFRIGDIVTRIGGG